MGFCSAQTIAGLAVVDTAVTPYKPLSPDLFTIGMCSAGRQFISRILNAKTVRLSEKYLSFERSGPGYFTFAEILVD